MCREYVSGIVNREQRKGHIFEFQIAPQDSREHDSVQIFEKLAPCDLGYLYRDILFLPITPSLAYNHTNSNESRP
jgi:hypothetical protein